MKRDELTKAYELVLENEGKGTVKTGKEMPKPGEGFKGKWLADTHGMGYDSPEAKKVQEPEEMDKELNPGHGTIMQEKEIKEMIPTSKFDKLFKETLMSEEFGDDESPVEMTGDEEFNDDAGDFPVEGEEDMVEDEVDVATQLRTVIDMLNDIAQQVGGEMDYDMGDEDMDDDMVDDMDDMDGAMGEAVHTGGPGKGKHDGKLGKFKNAAGKMVSKSSQKVSGTSSMQKPTAHGHAKPGEPGRGKHDGKIGKMKDSKMGMQSKSNMVVKGKAGTQGKDIFDAN